MEEKSDISLIINRSSIAPQSLDIETDVSNYYSQYMDTLGITNLSWYIFILISLLQWIWGSESCFISINMDFLGQKDNISNKSISICICILYSMMGVGAALVGILCKYMGRIYTLNLTLFIYVVITFCCSVFFFSFKILSYFLFEMY